MSYRAPWEWGVSAADTVHLCVMEVPGLVPDADGSGSTQRKLGGIAINAVTGGGDGIEQKSSQKAGSREDGGRCLDLLAEASEANRCELTLVSQGPVRPL